MKRQTDDLRYCASSPQPECNPSQPCSALMFVRCTALEREVARCAVLEKELARIRNVVEGWLADAAHHEARAAKGEDVVGFIESEVIEAQALTLRRCARDVQDE